MEGSMTGSGIFVTPEELESVKVAQSCSGMFLSGGMPMGDPGRIVDDLSRKYNAPKGTALNVRTGEFVTP